jgi:hypothetical protein
MGSYTIDKKVVGVFVRFFRAPLQQFVGTYRFFLVKAQISAIS